jgi:hypothetical protein
MKRADIWAFACVIAPQIFIAFAGPPPLLPVQLGEPTYIAHFSTRLVTVVLLLARLASWSPKFEQLQLASFLAGMPLVYLWAAWLRGTAFDLGVEALGFVVFGAAAVVGRGARG